MNRAYLVIIPTLMLLAGCSGSSTFHPAGKKVIFTEIIDSRASKVILSAGSSNVASIEPLMELLEAGNSDAKAPVVQRNIMGAVQPKNLIQGIGDGFKEVLLGLGAVETKESRMVDDQFVAESTLYRCEVKENSDEVYVLIEAESMIKHRISGDVVWKESADTRVNIVPVIDGKRVENPSAKQLATLFSGSEDEILAAVHAAMATIGRDLGQRVRKTATKWDVAPGR